MKIEPGRDPVAHIDPALRPVPSYTWRQWLVGAVGAAIAFAALFAIYELGFVPRKAIETGTARATSLKAPDRSVTARTRRISVTTGRGGERFWEVEIAPGRWADCRGDCANVLRVETFGE